MSKVRFINKQAQKYHMVLLSTDSYLLIVTWGGHQEALMTREAFEALYGFLAPADKQSCQSLEITGESAARLGYTGVWTVDDVYRIFGQVRT